MVIEPCNFIPLCFAVDTIWPNPCLVHGRVDILLGKAGLDASCNGGLSTLCLGTRNHEPGNHIERRYGILNSSTASVYSLARFREQKIVKPSRIFDKI